MKRILTFFFILLISTKLYAAIYAEYNSKASRGGGGSDSGLSNPVTVAQGGTGLTTATEDTTLIGFGGTYNAQTLPECLDSGGNHLNYSLSSNAFSCGSSSSGGSAHNILSSTHSDSTAATIARGDLITGQGASPTWTALAKGGATTYLKSDGTDLAWDAIDLGTDTTGSYAAGDAEAGAALSGDSATSFFSTGAIEGTVGGTGLTTATADTTLIGFGSSYNAQTLPNCPDSSGNHLNYIPSSKAFSCGTSSSGGTDTNSVKEYWWPAAATLPLQNADSIPPIAKDAGTNVDQLIVDFDDSTDECRGVSFKVPSDVQSGSTITFVWHGYSAAAATGAVMLDFRHNGGVADGVDPDVSLTTEPADSDTVPGTAGQLSIVTWTETLANTGFAANDQVDGYFCRDADGTGGTDSLAGDWRTTGFSIQLPRA